MTINRTIETMHRAAEVETTRGVERAKRPGLGELLLLTRPYSWIDTILSVLVGLTWTEASYPVGRLASAAAIALLLWFSLNWTSEAVQRDVGRHPPRWKIAILPLSLASAWSLMLGGKESAIWLGLFWALVVLYPWKARNAVLGPLGPVLRGLQTGTLFMLGGTFGGGHLPMRACAALGLIQAARSLVADIRDSKSDLYELPQRIGNEASKWIATAALSVGVLLLPGALFHFGAQALLILTLIPLLLAPTEYAYEIHLWMIVTVPLAKLALYTQSGNSETGLVWSIIVPVQLLLTVTYWYVPRLCNVTFREHMNRSMRVPGEHK